MPEYAWIYKNRPGSEYASYNTYHEVTPQINEYFLRDIHYQNMVKDLRSSTLEKELYRRAQVIRTSVTRKII